MNKTPEVIYLIPIDEDEYVWCEDPAPHTEMKEEDAIKYIRADTLEQHPEESIDE